MSTRGASTLCTGRCKRLPDPFRTSALVPRIQICRFCGAQREALAPPSVLAPAWPHPAPPTLYTLGYAGARLEQVIETLAARQVQVLLDTRWSASSCAPGFDGGTLRQAVEGHGLAYRHRAELGSPPNLRWQLSEEGDWEAFAAAYLAQLTREAPLLTTIAGWGRQHPVYLLCREHEAARCHHSLLATRLAELGGLEVAHLSVW